ncbi:hypothetical protein Tco_0913811, partial [Tanacetum coccineum]
MFYQKNVDYVALLWEDFMFQADNREISSVRKENMPYPRFTKAIISHFISKDKTISMRNKIYLHTIRDDSLLEEEPAKKPKRAKKPKPAKQADTAKKTALAKKSTTMPTAGVVIRDTHGVSTSKKKAQAKVDIDLLSDVALLEATQLKKALKKSKQDTHMLYPSGSDDEVGSQPKVPDELKEKTTGINEGTVSGDDDDSNDDDGNNVEDNNDYEQANDERTESDDEEEEKQDDEFVRTPEHYVPTQDETNDKSDDVTKEEYERINEELYGNVNVSLKDAEPTNKEEGDVEMTVAGQVNVNQEDAGNQVKDDAQATQKTKGLILSSSISSDYAAKYLNFDNISSVNTEVVSLLDINVQHEVSRTSPLLTIPVSLQPQLTISESETLAAFHQRITDLEKDVKEIKSVDHSATLLSTIKCEVPNVVKEYLGTSLDDALHKVLKKHSADITKEHFVPAKIVERLRQQYVPEKSTKDIRKIKIEHIKKQQEPKETITSSDTTALIEFDQKTILFETMTKSKSFNENEGVADKLKKMKQDDADKDEGPSAGLDQRMLKALTNRLDWNNPERKEYSFNLSKPLPLIMVQGHQVVHVHYFINNDLKYLRGGSSSKKYTTSTTKTKAAKYDILGIEDMVPLLWSPIKWYNYGYLEEIEVQREDKQLYKFKEALRMFSRRIVIIKRVEDLQLGVKSYQNKLNITKPCTFKSDISNRTPYTAYNNPQRIIYVDKYKRNRLMRSDKLYKFSDRTLTFVRSVIHDIASNLRIDYLPKRRWSNLHRQRSRIMIKAIDNLMFEIRLMRSLEKFVGGRDYGEDFRLLERTDGTTRTKRYEELSVAEKLQADCDLKATNIICHRLPNQDFVEALSKEEIVPFIKELGYTCKCDMLTKIHTDHMHQPWRTFAAVINRCMTLLTFTVWAIKDSKAYKIYIAYATGAATPKKARKFKKPASPSKKKTLVKVKEEELEPDNKDKPTKKPTTKRQDNGDDDDSNDDSNDDVNEEAQDDEYIHTPEDYVHNEDETNDESKEFDEQYYEELYGDVNISLKDAEPADKEKGDVEMTNTEIGDAELENVNQEGAGNQVKDNDQAT